MGRKAADRALDQKIVDDEFVANDILTNCRLYPKDEAPAAYKDFDEVLKSVTSAGLASPVATLKAPSGIPHSASISAINREVSGVTSDGFSTTALPAASAGMQSPKELLSG